MDAVLQAELSREVRRVLKSKRLQWTEQGRTEGRLAAYAEIATRTWSGPVLKSAGAGLVLKEVKPGVHRWVREDGGGGEFKSHPHTNEHAYDAATRQGNIPLPTNNRDEPITHEQIASAKADKDTAEELLDSTSGRDHSLTRFHIYGGTTQINARGKEAVSQMFGREIPHEEWVKIACAPPGAAVHVRATPDGIMIRADHPEAQSIRHIKKTPDGLVCKNESINVTTNRAGTGTKLFSEQVDSLRAMGVKRIETEAARDDSQKVVGYLVWPKLGYDGPIPKRVMKQLPPEFSGAQMVSDLMKTPEGREWWKKNGDSAKMSFDLSDGSRSLAVLSAYQQSKKDAARV